MTYDSKAYLIFFIIPFSILLFGGIGLMMSFTYTNATVWLIGVSMILFSLPYGLLIAPNLICKYGVVSKDD